jgi:hypothetical protein
MAAPPYSAGSVTPTQPRAASLAAECRVVAHPRPGTDVRGRRGEFAGEKGANLVAEALGMRRQQRRRQVVEQPRHGVGCSGCGTVGTGVIGRRWMGEEAAENRSGRRTTSNISLRVSDTEKR